MTFWWWRCVRRSWFTSHSNAAWKNWRSGPPNERSRSIPNLLDVEDSILRREDPGLILKYLGVILDRKLTWAARTTCAANRGGRQMRAFPDQQLGGAVTLIWGKGHNLQDNRCPIVLYVVAGWSHATKTHKNKIRVIQNKVLKTIINPPWYVRWLSKEGISKSQPPRTPYVKGLLGPFPW